jgi:hypothetical protein
MRVWIGIVTSLADGERISKVFARQEDALEWVRSHPPDEVRTIADYEVE